MVFGMNSVSMILSWLQFSGAVQFFRFQTMFADSYAVEPHPCVQTKHAANPLKCVGDHAASFISDSINDDGSFPALTDAASTLSAIRRGRGFGHWETALGVQARIRASSLALPNKLIAFCLSMPQV